MSIVGKTPNDPLDGSALRPLNGLSCRAVRAVAKAFQLNWDRTFSLATFMPNVIFFANMRAHHQCIAAFNLTGNPSPIETTPQQDAKILKEFRRLVATWQKKQRVDAAELARRWMVGVAGINELLTFPGNRNPVRLAVEGMLPSILLSVWTAIEVLAGDLWEAALNAHPHGLAELKGNKAKWGAREGAVEHGRSKVDEGDDKTILLAHLQKHRYDLTRHMGTALRNRFRFTILAGARAAYATAFYKDFGKIQSAMMSESLDHLAAVRNLLVHKAGVVDNSFKSQTKSLSLFDGVLAGDSLKLNGKVVVELVNPAISQAAALIVAVDEWITGHQNK